MVNPFEIPETPNPFDEPAGQAFNIYADGPSILQSEPITEPINDEPTTTTPFIDYVYAEEAATMLGITRNHLRQLTFKKKLNVAKREGRCSLYSMIDINDYKEAHNAKP